MCRNASSRHACRSLALVGWRGSAEEECWSARESAPRLATSSSCSVFGPSAARAGLRFISVFARRPNGSVGRRLAEGERLTSTLKRPIRVYSTHLLTGRPVARPSATSPRSPRPVAARSGACAARAAREGAPAPTLLRTPRTARRIWSSRRGPRGRGGRLAPRRSAGATRTSPRWR